MNVKLSGTVKKNIKEFRPTCILIKKKSSTRNYTFTDNEQFNK